MFWGHDIIFLLLVYTPYISFLLLQGTEQTGQSQMCILSFQWCSFNSIVYKNYTFDMMFN